ncbi:hypothetical protein PYW07_007399 [Mythimna separata]|uniref:Peptidase S1 domain-containing protein n=1 Tax=Mythimna separata TaxID=271217 RepID=A0AAD7Z3C2_MYTSE|nr:hypothetical protein PYW07_007399 [Mythimna separata]
MQVLVVLSLSLIAVSAVPANPQRIVGGALTTVDQYPTIAALLYSYFGTSYSQACGGTIITHRAILTAGHCPSGDSILKWRVRVGSSFANSGGLVHTVIGIFVHPNYNPRTIDNDVAILRTTATIVFGSVVQPAPIAGVNYNLRDNDTVIAAGWGTTSSGGYPSEQLRHVQLWVINQSICRSRVLYKYWFTTGIALKVYNRVTMRVIVVLLAGLAAVSAVPAFPQRIVGGSVTTIDHYPTIVALLFSWNASAFAVNGAEGEKIKPAQRVASDAYTLHSHFLKPQIY